MAFVWKQKADDKVAAPPSMPEMVGGQVRRRKWECCPDERWALRRIELTVYLGVDQARMAWILWECQVFDDDEAQEFMSSGVRLFELAPLERVVRRWDVISPANLSQYAMWSDLLWRPVSAPAYGDDDERSRA